VSANEGERLQGGILPPETRRGEAGPIYDALAAVFAGVALVDPLDPLIAGRDFVGGQGLDRSSVEDAAFSEIEGRVAACGEGNYPFEVLKHSIRRREGFERSPYTFQLLLSHVGLVHETGLPSPEKVFEEMSAQAAKTYFGSDGLSLALAFGFPRRYEARSFRAALDHLCGQLGEGGGGADPGSGPEGLAKRKRLAEQKDGKLDIVAWRPFPDGRAGKLIGFGQCATGSTDWRNKLAELQPDVFAQRWLRENLPVKPVRMFFVPRRVEEHEWKDVAVQAGLLFDRCRIAHNSFGLDDEVASECERWTKYILRRKLLGGAGRAKKSKGSKRAPKGAQR
jgi:hypothetical protein